MHRWSEELRRIAHEQGEWEIVDVEQYSRPVQDDIRLFDGTHCASSYLSLSLRSLPRSIKVTDRPPRVTVLRTEAIDPVVDEIIARLGFCSERVVGEQLA